MPARAVHCPFLNRSDDRCASHFSLDHLNDAFDQCLGAYQSCPVYLELLAERQLKRAAASVENLTRAIDPWSRIVVPAHAAGLVPLTLTASPRRDAPHA